MNVSLYARCPRWKRNSCPHLSFFHLGMNFYQDNVGIGELMYNLQNQPVTKTEKDEEKDSSSVFQPQQQQLPKPYSLNPQVPHLQVICIKSLSNLLHHVATCHC